MSAAALIAATWPPVTVRAVGAITLRDGAGGGKRVEAASATDDTTEADLDAAGAGLYVVWAGQERLDQLLEARGYRTVDPTLIMSCDINLLSDPAPPPVSGFRVWPPLQVQREIWASGGIGAERLAVMHRVDEPKISILGRCKDAPAGTAFVALRADTTMVHAVEVRANLRRNGMATHMMRHAARWAKAKGGKRLCVLVTEANATAIEFYRGLGLTGARCYHYRRKPEDHHP